MGRLLRVFAIVFALSGFCVAQSLGDLARTLRANRAASPNSKRVYTDEDFSSGLKIRQETSAEAVESMAKDAESKEKAAADKGDNKNANAGKPEEANGEQMQALEKDWRAKFAEQKKQIAQSERELDLLQRENKLRAAAFYGDAGTRLRNEKKFAEDDRKYQEQIAGKQKDLDAAKQKLDQMKEELRRLGLPSRWAD